MTTTSPSFTKEIVRNRANRDFDMFLDGQYIGSRDTYHQAEVDLDRHVIELLSSDLVIPATTLDGQCGDCGQTLDSLGLCGCGAEEPTPYTISEPQPCAGLQEDCRYYEVVVSGAHYRLHDEWPYGVDFREQRLGLPDIWVGRDLKEDFPTSLPIAVRAELRAIWERLLSPSTAPLSCSICGAPAPILEAHGAFCGGCYEASRLWQLWKTDSTAFVWSLRQQRARLNEMAERLATYLSRKYSACLSCDSVLAMWHPLLDDDGPPEPRFYVVVARQQVAA